jgi:hypothetical protein
LDKNKTEIDKLKLEITNKEKKSIRFMKTSPKPKELQEPKARQRPRFKEKIAKHNLAKQELDTLQKTNLAKIAVMEKTKTLQTDLDKKVTETQPIIDLTV